MTTLKTNQLHKTYARPNADPVQALVDISLQIEPGEFVAVRGPSGCGKTTLLLAAGGLLRPDKGKVLIAGEDMYARPPEDRARLRATAIGFVFQQFHLIPYLNVIDNILAPTMALPCDPATMRERAEKLIARFNLTDRSSHYPADLSTGERQRTALARALINTPKLLLADEPTGNLDAANAKPVLERMAEFCSEGGAVMMVTHEEQAVGFAARTLQMENGQLRSLA